jgi:hypothetical protein
VVSGALPGDEVSSRVRRRSLAPSVLFACLLTCAIVPVFYSHDVIWPLGLSVIVPFVSGPGGLFLLMGGGMFAGVAMAAIAIARARARRSWRQVAWGSIASMAVTMPLCDCGVQSRDHRDHGRALRGQRYLVLARTE